MVGTYMYHYIAKLFCPEKRGCENGLFSSFLVIVCFHNTESPCVFLRLATVAATVITDFKIFTLCTSKNDRHHFLKLVAKEMKWANESRDSWKFSGGLYMAVSMISMHWWWQSRPWCNCKSIKMITGYGDSQVYNLL
jgi:hypothetical protein